ncbi:MAG: NusG domain II-containing protein [Evtepia sp.]
MKRQTRLWLTILSTIILLSIIALFIFYQARKPGDTVSISQNGTLLYTLPLSQDTDLTIPAPNGGFNRVIIENHTVRIEEASCPDQICVRQGAISETGRPIVCLPNQLVLELHSDKSPELDGVTS